MSTTEHGFLPRWRQLEETAFWYAERAARATNATERDGWTTAAMETVVAIARMALSANQIAPLRERLSPGSASPSPTVAHIASRTRRPYQRGNSHDDEL